MTRRRARPPLRRGLLLLVGLAAALPVPAPAVVRDRQARTLPARPSTPIEIRVPEGTVDIRGEDRTDISVVVERDLSDSAAAASWPIAIDEEEDHLAVHVFPPPAVLGPAAATVTVAAPRATHLRLVDVGEGRLVLRGWRGPVTARVARGPIQGDDLAGILRLETSVGDITLRGFDLRRDGLLRCRTMNGNISVTLSRPPADARVLLLTMGGRVLSDLPVTDREGFGGRLKEGLIGNAQPLLSLDAVRGDLTVRLPAP
jgi:hypothetical protein